MATQAGIVNYALELIDSQAQITGSLPNFDGTAEGNAAAVIYTPTLQLLLRQLDPDFARTIVKLSPAADTSPLPPWAYEYAYPSDCLRARQIAPPQSGAGALIDPFDPQPIRGQIAFDPAGGGIATPAKVILTNQANAWLAYTTLSATEAMFDPAFIEAFARRLGSPLAMAIAGRPDFARELLEESERYAGMAELVDESMDGTA